ncbi:hypothetical protein BDN72DRAFT_882943 [Pluteus cervinus]|uniref:Uncharacterized protein n=1 Tax=Pluteus cervinus TaxID=181527 RepID=A0ACD3A8D5_9AGAR|nr:hypothetical protein BDN72DRAFT_882943 [Pluteus cervinus]
MTTLDVQSTLVPRLPPELERIIFEICASSQMKSAVVLVRVAKRVHVWIQPVLYRVVIKAEAKLPPKYHTTSSLSVISYGPFVRHLLLGYSVSNTETIKFLSSCNHLRNLALWTPNIGPHCLDWLDEMPLERLSTNLSRLFTDLTPTTFLRPFFSQITHLEITNTCSGWEKWCGLSILPSLTHLALDFFFDPEVVEGCLIHCQKLKLLVLVYDSDTIMSSNLIGVLSVVRDPRVVPHCMVREELKWEQSAWIWEDGPGRVGKGLDFWSLAEIVANQYTEYQGLEVNPF